MSDNRILQPSAITIVPSVSAEIKENLQRFIEMFPADDPQWRAIRQSLGAVADTPENYLQVFKSHFALNA